MDILTTIKIGGTTRQIASYENLLLKEPGNIELGVKSLSPFQYNSMLFANLGYDKCPKDLLWIEKGIPIEQVPKSEVLDYPITNNKLMIINRDLSLYDVLTIAKNWIKDGNERGHLLDMQKAFALPSLEEMKYDYQNHIKIMRTNNVKSRIDVWDKADVFCRRIFNMNPEKDSEYFEFSLINMFEDASKLVPVQDPAAIFVSILMDPDIIMSVIRQAEKQAAHAVFNRNISVPTALLNCDDILKEFSRLMTIRFKQISNIFRSRGAIGFIDQEKEKLRLSNLTKDNTDLKSIMPYLSPESMMLIKIEYDHILNTTLDGSHIAEVKSYIEPNTLKFIDNMGDDSEIRRLTYKRLFYELVNHFEKFYPEALNKSDKFVMSESFYVNPQCFALYKKGENKFYICEPYLNCIRCSPQEAIAYYHEYVGKDVLLNPNEVGESLESPLCPEIDLDVMEMKALGIYGNMQVQLPYQPVMELETQQPQQPINDERVYGMQHLVEGMS